MIPVLYKLTILAQAAFDDPSEGAPAPAAPAAPVHRLSFSDLQKRLDVSNHGDPNDRPFQLALLAMVGVIVVIALILQLRQRRKDAGPLNSPYRLGRELSRKVPFPFGTRLLLAWVARTAGVPMATLLLSTRAFDNALETWSKDATFGLVRQWGHARLKLLKPILFDPA
jgi:hypothetical protein